VAAAEKNPPAGRPLRLDPSAESRRPDRPAFLARPPGAPVYHGFPVIESSTVDGFKLGMITDFVAAADAAGDGFVVAPDGSRAGLVWESESEFYVTEVLAPDAERWGVWAVGVPLPLGTEGDARPFMEALVPELRSRWERWRASQKPDSGLGG
jgi:hypothetical protein